MRMLAQARNLYSRSWLWIPGSLAEPVIGPASGRTRWLAPRNDDLDDRPHRDADRADRDPDVVAACGHDGRDRHHSGIPTCGDDVCDRRLGGIADLDRAGGGTPRSAAAGWRLGRWRGRGGCGV